MKQMHDAIRKFSGLEIAVIGDLMMDEYVWGQANRVSPESPVLVIDVQRETAVPGGAANVASNILALGAKVRVLGAVGSDEVGQELRASLAVRGADVTGVITDPTRPTTRKTRVVAQSQQVLRIDRELSVDLSKESSAELLGHLETAIPSANAVLLSDYAKGVVNKSFVPDAIKAVRGQKKPFLANAKPPNASLLAGASLVTINLSEALATSGDQRFNDDELIHNAGHDLRLKLKVDILVVTRGPKGLCAWTSDGEAVAVPAHPVAVYDVAGAGDTVVSILTLCMAAGVSINIATRLAVIAAGIVVGKVGVATVTAEELLANV